MATEGATLIFDLDPAAPTGQGPISDGDDEFRQLKTVLQSQFPNFGDNEVSASAEELSYVTGVTDPIQTQLDNLAIIQGYGGFASAQTGDQISLPANNIWQKFVQAGANIYSDGVVVSSNAATGTISILSGSPMWVRLHALVTLERRSSTAVASATPFRSKFIRESNNGQPSGALMVSVIPDFGETQGFIIEAIDSTPASSGEVYHLELNQDHNEALNFKIDSMNIWAEVIGRT